MNVVADYVVAARRQDRRDVLERLKNVERARVHTKIYIYEECNYKNLQRASYYQVVLS